MGKRKYLFCVAYIAGFTQSGCTVSLGCGELLTSHLKKEITFPQTSSVQSYFVDSPFEQVWKENRPFLR